MLHNRLEGKKGTLLCSCVFVEAEGGTHVVNRKNEDRAKVIAKKCS